MRIVIPEIAAISMATTISNLSGVYISMGPVALNREELIIRLMQDNVPDLSRKA